MHLFLKHRSISGVWTMFGFMSTHTGDAADAVESIQVPEESTLGLRIAAIFIILSAGLLGGVPPLIIKALRNQDSLLTFLIRAFSAGVILALAFVHILPGTLGAVFTFKRFEKRPHRAVNDSTLRDFYV